MNKSTQADRKKQFIRVLAEYLGGPNQCRMSILLGVKNQEAEQWAKIRGASPLFGYPSIDEADEILTEFLM